MIQRYHDIHQGSSCENPSGVARAAQDVAEMGNLDISGGFNVKVIQLPSGKQPHNYGKSLFLMGKLTISMGHFQ